MRRRLARKDTLQPLCMPVERTRDDAIQVARKLCSWFRRRCEASGGARIAAVRMHDRRRRAIMEDQGESRMDQAAAHEPDYYRGGSLTEDDNATTWPEAREN